MDKFIASKIREMSDVDLTALLSSIGADKALNFMAAMIRAGRPATMAMGIVSHCKRQVSVDEILKNGQLRFGWVLPEPRAPETDEEKLQNQKLVDAIKDETSAAAKYIQENDPGAWAKWKEICQQKICEGTRLSFCRRMLDTNEELLGMIC